MDIGSGVKDRALARVGAERRARNHKAKGTEAGFGLAMIGVAKAYDIGKGMFDEAKVIDDPAGGEADVAAGDEFVDTEPNVVMKLEESCWRLVSTNAIIELSRVASPEARS
jgi:hypothetical protein